MPARRNPALDLNYVAKVAAPRPSELQSRIEPKQEQEQEQEQEQGQES